MLRNLMTNIVYGRDFPTDATCVCHGNPVTDKDFRDDVSKKEYLISGFCQKTQDVFFNPDNDMEG
jgi:hypothetical protein